MNAVLRMACAAAGLVAGAMVAAAQPATPEARVNAAIEAFDQAMALSRSDPREAERLYERAAAEFQALREDGFRNAALEYNLGVTAFRLGELGRSVLHFRRALLLDPRDEAAAANLAYVRQRVQPQLPPGGSTELLDRLFILQHYFGISSRFWIGLVLAGAGWAAVAVWLRRRWQPLLAGGAVLIVLALGFQGSVAWQLYDHSQRPPAVVAGGEHTLRLGRGESYDPAMNERLGPGVELRILQERGEWIEVRLPNGIVGWLPEFAVERV